MTNSAPNGQLSLAARRHSRLTEHVRGPVISPSGLPRVAAKGVAENPT